jgi:hypothetical protein
MEGGQDSGDDSATNNGTRSSVTSDSDGSDSERAIDRYSDSTWLTTRLIVIVRTPSNDLSFTFTTTETSLFIQESEFLRSCAENIKVNAFTEEELLEITIEIADNNPDVAIVLLSNLQNPAVIICDNRWHYDRVRLAGRLVINCYVQSYGRKMASFLNVVLFEASTSQLPVHLERAYEDRMVVYMPTGDAVIIGHIYENADHEIPELDCACGCKQSVHGVLGGITVKYASEECLRRASITSLSPNPYDPDVVQFWETAELVCRYPCFWEIPGMPFTTMDDLVPLLRNRKSLWYGMHSYLDPIQMGKVIGTVDSL